MTNVGLGLLLGVVMASAVIAQELWYKARRGRQHEDARRIGRHFTTLLVLGMIAMIFLPLFSLPEERENLGWTIIVILSTCFLVLSLPSSVRLARKKRRPRRL